MSAIVVHVGDFHASPGPRNADRYRTLDQILDESEQLPVAAFAWPGDLFDGVSTPDDRNAIDARLKRMSARAPVVIVEGNHDKKGDLRGFENVAASWPITVVDERPRVISVRLATGGMASIFCIPYPYRGGLVGTGVAHGDQVALAEQLYDPIFLAAAHELAQRRAGGALTLCLFHAHVAGAIASAGQPIVGQEIELTRALLNRLGPIYKGGNHIHRPQEIHGAWFAGSTARKDYGETEAKRYLVVRIEADSSFQVESRPLQVPPMFLVDGALDRDGFRLSDDSDDETALRFAAQDWAGCDVRARYTYLASERRVIDEGRVRARFAAALHLKVEGVCVPDREVRAAAVSHAKTLTDKLAAMRPDGQLPAAIADKVAALEQRDGAEVLADVRTWLASIETPQHAMVAA